MKIEINTNTITIDQNQVLKFLGYGKKDPHRLFGKKCFKRSSGCLIYWSRKCS